jgi:hypothetical protein
MDQWYEILWTDEMWVTGGRHTRTWITRRAGEESDRTGVFEKQQRKKVWMFGAVFTDKHKGRDSFGRRIGGTYVLKCIGNILSRLFMAKLSFKEEKAYISSLYRMELPGIQRRIPSRIYKEEELRLFLGLLLLLN